MTKSISKKDTVRKSIKFLPLLSLLLLPVLIIGIKNNTENRSRAYSPSNKATQQTLTINNLEEPGKPGSVLGWLDAVDYRGIFGWTCDTTQPGKQISFAIRYGPKNGKKTIEYFQAKGVRAELIKTLCKSTTPNHGFVIPLPQKLRAGDIVEAYGLDETGYVQLLGSPKQYYPRD